MKFLKIVLIVVLIMTATVAGAALRLKEFWDLTGTPIGVPKPVDPSGPSSKGPEGAAEGDEVAEEQVHGIVNVLLVGLDDYESVRRSDSIAVAAFDSFTQSVRILSIPRDSRVRIPGRGLQKINHAYAYGGVDLLKETVTNFLGVELHYFVVLGFQSFPKVIDLIGGIDIDVEKKLVYRDRSQNLYINIPKGPQHMDGQTALKYVRFRHDALGDIGRVGRQQKFISLVADKLKSPSIWPTIPSLVSEVLAAVNTDLTPLEALKLARFANDLPGDKISLHMAPGRDATIEKLSYWIVDANAASAWLAGDMEEYAAADAEPLPGRDELQDLVSQIGTIGILNGDGGGGLGKRASEIFRKLGIEVAYIGNANHFNYRTSNIVYPESAEEYDRQAADALARLCGIADERAIRKTGTSAMVSVVLGRDNEALFKRLESLGADDF